MYDLQQAMIRDADGVLKELVEQFINADSISVRDSLMNQILFRWAGVDNVAPESRGNNIDARKLGVLEQIFGVHLAGTTNPNPSRADSEYLEESYQLMFEYCYSALMAQSHLKDLYDKIIYTLDETTNLYTTDMSGLLAELQSAFANDPEQCRQLVGEFARTMRGLGHSREDCLACREIFIQMDPSLGWVIDTGGLPAYDTSAGPRPGEIHLNTSDRSEAIQASPIYWDGIINGWNGNDVIYGTSRNERLTNDSGDAVLVGGGGNDRLWAGADNDILDGGEGNDQLLGETGNDTYIFRRGSGQDTIIDADSTAGNIDTIWLGSNLTPEDVTLKRSGNNLVLKINDTTDTLTVQNYFGNNSTINRIEQIQFMDGTVWNEDDIMRESQVPTDGDDIFYGTSGNDTIYAMAA